MTYVEGKKTQNKRTKQFVFVEYIIAVLGRKKISLDPVVLLAWKTRLQHPNIYWT